MTETTTTTEIPDRLEPDCVKCGMSGLLCITCDKAAAACGHDTVATCYICEGTALLPETRQAREVITIDPDVHSQLLEWVEYLVGVTNAVLADNDLLTTLLETEQAASEQMRATYEQRIAVLGSMVNVARKQIEQNHSEQRPKSV